MPGQPEPGHIGHRMCILQHLSFAMLRPLHDRKHPRHMPPIRNPLHQSGHGHTRPNRPCQDQHVTVLGPRRGDRHLRAQPRDGKPNRQRRPHGRMPTNNLRSDLLCHTLRRLRDLCQGACLQL